MTADSIRFLPCGDTALAVEFGHQIDRAVNEAVLALDARLASMALEGIVETVPTFRSLLIHYDPLTLAPATLQGRVEEALASGGETARAERRWHIPACYEGDLAPDLDDVARETGLSTKEVVERHRAIEFHVYMLGFLPGYPYMGDLPEVLRLPRRVEPRVRVPPGSVAIAMAMTAVYPVESPGGWRLIGRSPVRLFDAGWEQPALLQPGDKVVFAPISPGEFETLRGDVEAGRFTPEHEVIAS